MRVKRLRSSSRASAKQESTDELSHQGNKGFTEAFKVVLLAACFKILLFPAYKSTDFEVHRNWLAITHGLPMEKWYYEKTSIWTLDYPPFFAWFEWVLSFGASLIDGEMLDITKLGYDSKSTVYYQRSTVIVSELVFAYAVWKFVRLISNVDHIKAFCVIFLTPGLLIVDHIHFQYNGFLYGLLLLSLFVASKGQYIKSAILFAILLNFKHIYLYLAPAYFVHLLKVYCFDKDQFKLSGFLTLGFSVITVFAASFLPFIHQIPQVLSRLFPFKRGLNHAYWAANFWALYSFLDLILAFGAKSLLGIKLANNSGLTRGIVGDAKFSILPDILPIVTLILTVLSHIPGLISVWSKPTFESFLKTVTLCAYGSFLFGWHVHEKAILMITIPLSILFCQNPNKYGQIFMLVQSAGHVALFPLLYRPSETWIKILAVLLYSLLLLSYMSISTFVEFKERFPYYQRLYLLGLVVVIFLQSFGHLILFRLGEGEWQFGYLWSELNNGDDWKSIARFSFLPEMATSVYCFVGVIWSWMLLLYLQ